MRDGSVLITDVENTGHLAAVRSLGRAGYCVIACSDDPNALGFYSHYTTYAFHNPPYRCTTEFIQWLNTTIKQYNIKTILPSESFMFAIKEHFNEYAALLPYPMPEEKIYGLFSKYYLYDFLINNNFRPDITANIPPCYFLEPGMDESGIGDVVSNVTYPVFLKVPCTDLYTQRAFKQSVVQRLDSPEDALVKIKLMKTKYTHLLLQECVSGIDVGVSFLRWNGRIILHFMHLGLHEPPYSSDSSSYRQSWWHEAIYQDALAKLNALDYNGIVMFEYQWSEKTDLFYFMEVDPHFWPSLHLPLYVGIDFPKELLRCMRETTRDETTTPPLYPINVRFRATIPDEIDYVKYILEDRKRSLKNKIYVVFEFFYLMFNPKVHSDYFFKKDNFLYFLNVVFYSRMVFGRIMNKLIREIRKKFLC